MNAGVNNEKKRPPARPAWRRGLKWLAAAAVLLVAGFTGLLWWGQEFLFFPGAYVAHRVDPNPPPGAVVWERDVDGVTVDAWLLLGKGSTAETPGPAAVFFHGNGELINIWAGEMSWYTERGYTVLLPEYRGYGRSDGAPSQAAIVDDATHFFDRLVALPAVDASRVVLHGRSLGGGVAAQVAALRPAAALVLASTFSSGSAMARGVLPFAAGFMIRHPFETEAALKTFDGPTLILHGDRDGMSPDHARRNAAAARDATLVIYPGVGHNDMPSGHGSWDDILPFLDRAGLPWRVGGEWEEGGG